MEQLYSVPHNILLKVTFSYKMLSFFQVTKDDKSFQNIMRCYRTQPQARSQVGTFPSGRRDSSVFGGCRELARVGLRPFLRAGEGKSLV